MLARLLFVAATLFSVPLYAAEPLKAISTSDPDYDYYMRAIEMDNEYIANGLVESEFYPYKFYGNHPGLGTVSGRVVVFRDGPVVNPTNVVLTVNGQLYYVNSELAQLHHVFNGKIFRIRRSWDRQDPGIYLVFQGTRRDPSSKLKVSVQISVKIATVHAKALPELTYYETRAK